MIIVKLIGGLGNQMFQYALGRHLAIINDAKLKLDVSDFKNYRLRHYALFFFNISADITSGVELKFIKKFNENKISDFLGMNYILVKQKNSGKEKNLHYDESILKKRGNLYVDGSWQCEKYFEDIRPVLIEDFTVKSGPDEKIRAMLNKIKGCNSVCVHVRRGDYVKNPETNKVHGTCSLQYYRNSIGEIENKVKAPLFCVFSDDIEWCKENLKIKHPAFFVDFNAPEKAHEDLRLMSNCRHFIIANSSFSWWGAWLSENKNKIVCAPKKWFNELDEGDIVPKSWIRVGG